MSEGAAGARLAELAAEWELDAPTVARLERLLAALAADPTAPTAVREPAAAVDVHVADSLTGLAVPAVRAARRIVDIGAGAGFPGLVLAAALPAACVTLVESTGRKATAIEGLAAAAGIDNADVVAARAEAWPEGLGTTDVVTARALAPLPVLAEYAAPLLRLGGTLVAWKGEPGAEEVADGAEAATQLGLEPLEPVVVRPYAASRPRRLHLYSKVTETPARFPRRPGMAAKRPLGAANRQRSGRG